MGDLYAIPDLIVNVIDESNTVIASFNGVIALGEDDNELSSDVITRFPFTYPENIPVNVDDYDAIDTNFDGLFRFEVVYKGTRQVSYIDKNSNGTVLSNIIIFYEDGGYGFSSSIMFSNRAVYDLVFYYSTTREIYLKQNYNGRLANITYIDDPVAKPLTEIPVNFYRTKPEDATVEANPGDLIEYAFNVVWEDGSEMEWPHIVWTYEGALDTPPYTVEGNNIRLYSSYQTTDDFSFFIKAKPKYFEDEPLFSLNEIVVKIGGGSPSDDPYAPGGISRPGGGNGSFDAGPTDNPLTSIPQGTTEADASDTGIYTRYVLNLSDLTRVGDRLWTQDIIQQIQNTLAFLFSSPFESVISLMSYPFDIATMTGYVSVRRLMTWGNISFITDWFFDVLSSSSVWFDWGEVEIESFYDGFLDYAPYTKMELYLPWGVGTVPLDPNECTPGRIGVITNIELDKGTAVHIVTSTFTRDGREVKQILGTYCAVVGKQIPITALDTAGKSHALASLAVTAGAIALTGGAGAASANTSSALVSTSSSSQAAASGALAVSSTKLAPVMVDATNYPFAYSPSAPTNFTLSPESIKLATDGINASMTPGHISRNGSFMTGSAGLSPNFPFLTISRPEQSIPTNYGRYYGYPSNIYSILQNLSGYTEVGSIHLENIVCTEEERAELLNLLQGGVLL